MRCCGGVVAVTLQRSTGFAGTNAAAWTSPGGAGWTYSTPKGVFLTATEDILSNQGRGQYLVQNVPNVGTTSNTDTQSFSATTSGQTFQTSTNLAAQATSRFLLVSVVTKCATNTPVPTLSGLSLTWTQVATVAYGSSTHRLTTFWAYGTWSAGKITVDVGSGNSSTGWLIQVAKFNATGTTGIVVQSTTATGTSTTQTVTLPSALTNHNSIYTAFALDGNSTATGWTADQQLGDAGNATIVGRLATYTSSYDAASPLADSNNTSASRGYGAIAVEIKGASATAEHGYAERLMLSDYSATQGLEVRARITGTWGNGLSRPGVAAVASDGSALAVVGGYNSKTSAAAVGVYTRTAAGVWAAKGSALEVSGDAYIALRVGWLPATSSWWYAGGASASASPPTFQVTGTTTDVGTGPLTAGLTFYSLNATDGASAETFTWDDFEASDLPGPSRVRHPTLANTLVRAGRW